jgi:hypothetical protein
MLLLSGSTVWPEFSDAMPYATRVEEFPLQGEPIVLVDHTALVYDELNRFNATQGPLDAAGTGGAVGVGMQGPNAGSSAQEDRDVTAAGGCACMAAGRRQSPFWGASVLALLWAASRRRRRQSG